LQAYTTYTSDFPILIFAKDTSDINEIWLTVPVLQGSLTTVELRDYLRDLLHDLLEDLEVADEI